MDHVNATDAVLAATIDGGRGDDLAIVDGGQTFTYVELLDMVNRVGNGLRSHDVERENRVLLMLKDSPEFVAAYLGTMKIGAVAVALNPLCSPAELLFAINDSRCKFLIIDEDYLPAYRAISGQLLLPPRIIVAGSPTSGFPTLGIFTATQSPVLEAMPMSPDDMAFWIYTSGATGSPKATVHLQHDVLFADRYLRDVLAVAPGDRLFSTAKLFFAYALNTCLFGALRCGATIVLHGGPPDPRSLADVIERQAPRIVFGIPTHYRNLLRAGFAYKRPAFSAVEHYVSSGERLPITLGSEWERQTGRPILETVGTSETLCMVFANAPQAYRYGSSGRTAPGVQVKLINDAGQPVTHPHETGVLWVSLPSLCDRYWNQQERSRRAFHGGWFCTGDLFATDEDGFWYHEGRADDMLKVAGQWVSPDEIEGVAMSVPGVADAAAVGLQQEDGLLWLSLFIVADDPAADRGELSGRLESRLKASLAAYKWPREIRFIDQAPRTATGKIQRYRLRDRLQAIA